MMKNYLRLGLAVILGLTIPSFPVPSFAQTTTVVTNVSTTAAGNITKFTPNMLFIKTEGEPNPLAFVINKDTAFVDDQDKPVEIGKMRNGHAVIVYYVTNGLDKVASKIVVRNAP